MLPAAPARARVIPARNAAGCPQEEDNQPRSYHNQDLR